jgi:hypothetical protein
VTAGLVQLIDAYLEDEPADPSKTPPVVVASAAEQISGLQRESRYATADRHAHPVVGFGED